MKCFLVCLSASFVAYARASQAEVTPVQKVIQLLDGMLAKGKSEKHDEQVQFAAYKQFCDDTSVEKKRAISEAEEAIEVQKADIKKYTADAATLTKEIAVLKKQAYDRKQTSLAQVSALTDMSLIPKEAKAAIESFLAQDPQDSLAVAAPEAYGYEFQSHGVIEMLEKLLDKFVTERTELEKKEMNSKQAFEMLIQDLTAQIEQATADRESKSATKAKKLQSKADAEGDLTETTTTMEADTKYLNDLTALCEQKASDFESRQQLRAEEIEAIAKAIEILSSGAVTGNAAKYLPTLLQISSTALAQLKSNTHGGDQARATAYLREQAQRLNSRLLLALAVCTSKYSFVKVKKMLK